MRTDTEGRSYPWAQPILVTLAIIAPGLVPGGAPPADAAEWLVSGGLQNLSQLALLIVIIGAAGALRDYGVEKPRAKDVLRAVPLFVIVLAASKITAIVAPLAAEAIVAASAATIPDGAIAPRSSIPPANGLPFVAIVALSALFAASVAYREELFYRIYIIRSLRERGAGTIAAVMVSTMLFAAGHAYQGPVGIAVALLVGAIMATAAVTGVKLHSLALAHAAYDFFVLIAAFSAA